MKKVLILIVVLLFAIGIAVCNIFDWTDKTNEIDTIYVWHSAFGQTFPEYKIDLKNCELWDFNFNGNDFASFIERDPNAENEGFEFVSDLSSKSIKNFKKDAKQHGFLNWKDSYIDDLVFDGHQWGIKIVFADGTVKEIYGSNAYPLTWNKMRESLITLTDRDVLVYPSDSLWSN